MSLRTWSRADDSVAVDLADGARMVGLTLGGRQLLVPHEGRQPMWWGGFVMAPWTSLLRAGTVPGYEPDGDEAWHGTARTLTWRRTEDGAAADLPVPFEGLTARLSVELGDASCRLRLALTSSRDGVPAAVGWHPWFPRTLDGVEGSVVVPRETLAQARDADGRPTGLWERPAPGPWNNGTRLTGPVAIAYPGLGIIEVDSSSVYAILFEHEQGFCIEPTTSPAESLGHVVTPDAPLTLDITVTWREVRLAGGVVRSDILSS